MTLDSYYKKWESLAKSLDVSDDDAAAAAAAAPVAAVPRIDPKDIGVTIGRPLTEAEFAARQRKGGPAPKVFSASAQ